MSNFRGGRAPAGKRLAGTYTDARKAWVTLERMEAILYVDEETLVQDLHPGHSIMFSTLGARKRFTLSLTNMTEAEIVALRDFIIKALDDVLPLVRDLDKDAEDKHAQGDSSYPRLYRRLPVVVDRRGKVQEHGQSVPSGPGADSESAS